MSVQTDLNIVHWALLAATVVVFWWVIQYSMSAPWWLDDVGRSYALKDILLLAIMVPSCLIRIWPHMLTLTEGLWIEFLVFAGIAIVVGWRCVKFWKIQPPNPAAMIRAMRRRRRNGHRDKVPAP